MYLFGVQGIFGSRPLHFWVSSINISKLRSLTRVATLCLQLSPIRQSVASRLWRCEKGHCVSLSRSTCYSDKQKIRAKRITIYWISFFSSEQWTPFSVKMMMFPKLSIFKSIPLSWGDQDKETYSCTSQDWDVIYDLKLCSCTDHHSQLRIETHNVWHMYM